MARKPNAVLRLTDLQRKLRLGGESAGNADAQQQN